LLAALPAAADVEPAFVKLRDAATPVEGLGAFLDRYIGECSDAFAGSECQANAKAFRAQATGKMYYMIVSEDSLNMLAPGPFGVGRGEFSVNVTPFFPADGYAVTHGAPKRLDEFGNPVLPYINVKGAMQEGWNSGSVPRILGMRQLRMQVVFTPEDVWSLSKKGGGKIFGVRARVHALRITFGRTGRLFALWLEKGR